MRHDAVRSGRPFCRRAGALRRRRPARGSPPPLGCPFGQAALFGARRWRNFGPPRFSVSRRVGRPPGGGILPPPGSVGSPRGCGVGPSCGAFLGAGCPSVTSPRPVVAQGRTGHGAACRPEISRRGAKRAGALGPRASPRTGVSRRVRRAGSASLTGRPTPSAPPPCPPPVRSSSSSRLEQVVRAGRTRAVRRIGRGAVELSEILVEKTGAVLPESAERPGICDHPLAASRSVGGRSPSLVASVPLVASLRSPRLRSWLPCRLLGPSAVQGLTARLGYCPGGQHALGPRKRRHGYCSGGQHLSGPRKGAVGYCPGGQHLLGPRKPRGWRPTPCPWKWRLHGQRS